MQNRMQWKEFHYYTIDRISHIAFLWFSFFLKKEDLVLYYVEIFYNLHINNN